MQKLRKSVKKWVLKNLSTDRQNINLQRHLNSLEVSMLLTIYFNWKARQVSCNSRKVHISSAFKKNPVVLKYSGVLSDIVSDIEKGGDISPYLSRSIKVAFDEKQMPDQKKKLNRRRDLDLLLNDWGIHHLHISNELESDGFVSRTKPLLFVVFRPNDAYLIDVMDHGSWASRKLMEIVYKEFPEANCFMEINGVVGLDKKCNESEHQQFRNAGILSLLMMDRKVISSTSFLSTGGYSHDAVRRGSDPLNRVEFFEAIWRKDPEKASIILKKQNIMWSRKSVFEFYIDPIFGEGILERKSNSFMSLYILNGLLGSS